MTPILSNQYHLCCVITNYLVLSKKINILLFLPRML